MIYVLTESSGPLAVKDQQLIAGMNDVLNSEGFTQAAWWNRLPIAGWGLLARHRHFLQSVNRLCRGKAPFFVLPLSVSISFFLIADIDSPRRGTIRVIPQKSCASLPLSASTIGTRSQSSLKVAHKFHTPLVRPTFLRRLQAVRV